MKQETREERIKRLLEARESGTLDDTVSTKPASTTSVVPETVVDDWEEENRLISSKNQERIKEASQKSAELASKSAKAATKIAGQGLVKGIAVWKTVSEKVQQKKDEMEAARLKVQQERMATHAFVEPTNEFEQERSVDESSAPDEREQKAPKVARLKWLTPKLAVMVVGLIITGIGIAWFVRYERSPNSITQTPVDAPTPATPEVIQVMPVEAILPPSDPTPPTELPPLPKATPVALEPSATNPVAAALVAPKPQKTVQVASSPKTQPRPTAPKEKEKEAEWQKDASKKLDEWGF